jgi:hypothetical protein
MLLDPTADPVILANVPQFTMAGLYLACSRAKHLVTVVGRLGVW